MNGNEKSDPAIVAVKPANEPRRRGKERAERSAGAEGNAEGPHGVRAPDRAASHQGIDRVREAARKDKGKRFTALLHHIDAALLGQAYHLLKRDAAPGVDGMTWDGIVTLSSNEWCEPGEVTPRRLCCPSGTSILLPSL
jgi:hypothetical protein